MECRRRRVPPRRRKDRSTGHRLLKGRVLWEADVPAIHIRVEEAAATAKIVRGGGPYVLPALPEGLTHLTGVIGVPPIWHPDPMLSVDLGVHTAAQPEPR